MNRTKWRAAGKTLFQSLALSLCALALSACGDHLTYIEGRVIETSPGGNTYPALYYVETPSGETKCIALTHETYFSSNVNGLEKSVVMACQAGEIMVQADCRYSDGYAALGDGTLVDVYPAHWFIVSSRKTEEIAVAEDGTRLQVWEASGTREYRLEDGTMILTVKAPTGPANVSGPGEESLDDLTEGAQRKICQFYADRGILYDEGAALASAYAAYQETGPGESFYGLDVSQDVYPTFFNSRLIAFETSLDFPTDEPGVITFSHLGDVFDRETGEHLDNLDLFTYPKDEVISRLLDLNGGEREEPLRSEMETAFRSEYIVLHSNELEIVFPDGTLPSETYPYIIGWDYDYTKGLRDLLHEWALPDQ